MVFYELPAFAKFREDYLDDDAYKELQRALMANPAAGEVIKGTGGLRKLRFADAGRNKGKRGLRVIYFFKQADDQIWLFTLYGKDEADNLTSDQRKALKMRLEQQIKAGNLK